MYYLYQATKDPAWLMAGKTIMEIIQNRTRVVSPPIPVVCHKPSLILPYKSCGYAGIADVESGTLEDHMNSFFLAETLKYLYLLFDDGSNFVHSYDPFSCIFSLAQCEVY